MKSYIRAKKGKKKHQKRFTVSKWRLNDRFSFWSFQFQQKFVKPLSQRKFQ